MADALLAVAPAPVHGLAHAAQEPGQVLEILGPLAGPAHDAVYLQVVEAQRGDALHGGHEDVLVQALVHGPAQAGAGPLQGQGQAAHPGVAQERQQFLGQAVGAQGRQGEGGLALLEPDQELQQVGPVREGRAHQTHLARPGLFHGVFEVGQAGLARRAVDIARGAEPAAVGAAPVDLQHEHVPELGLGADETRRARLEARAVAGHGAHGPGPVAVRQARGVDPGTVLDGVQELGLGAPGHGVFLAGGQQLGQALLGLADEEEVHGRDGRGRVEEAQRPPGHDQGPVRTVLALQGHAAAQEHLGQAAHLVLHVQGEGDDRELGQGRTRVVGTGRLGTAVPEEALHGQARLGPEQAVDHLPAQGGQADAGRGREDQRHGQASAPLAVRGALPPRTTRGPLCVSLLTAPV